MKFLGNLPVGFVSHLFCRFAGEEIGSIAKNAVKGEGLLKQSDIYTNSLKSAFMYSLSEQIKSWDLSIYKQCYLHSITSKSLKSLLKLVKKQIDDIITGHESLDNKRVCSAASQEQWDLIESDINGYNYLTCSPGESAASNNQDCNNWDICWYNT